MPAATRIERRWRTRVLVLVAVSVTAAAATLALASPASAAIVSTTTSLSLDNTSVALNQAVTMTATVTAANGTMPSGTVNFLSVATDGTTTTIGTASLVGSTATFTTSSLAAGTYQLEAQYAGAFLSYSSSTSTPVQLSVAGVVLHNTSMTLSLDPSSFTAGDTATFTAHVVETDGVQVPTGTVTFSSIVGGVESVLGQADLDGSGTATLSVGGWQPGTYTVIAEYTGDRFDRSTSAQLSFTATSGQEQAVTTITTVSLSPPAIQTNGSVEITAQIVQSRTGAIPPAGDHVNFYATAAGSSEQVSIGQADVTWTADGSSPAVGVAHLTVAGWIAGQYTITADFVGDIFDTTSSGQAVLGVTSQAPTTLTYTGDVTQPFGTPANVSFQLTSGGNPVAGEPVTITVAGQDYPGVTDASGTVAVSVSPPVGGYTPTALFAGDSDYLPTAGSGALAVTPLGPAPTAIVDNTTGNFLQGSTVTLSGTLTTNGAPLAGKTVTLTLGTASCTAVTDANGVATCQVTVPGPTGPTTTTASFAGDPAYTPSTDTQSALVYANAPGGGSFVVGDQTATGSVTFWGAQWWKVNSLSAGDSQAVDPGAFKGFADSPATPQCGATWSANPGNSSKPPAGPLPSYMAVIVTDHNSKSGPVISGDTVAVVIVQTDTGYKNDPGHAGTGTVVATLCTGTPYTAPLVNCSAKGTKCESLLANASAGQGATVTAGQTLSILYTDDDAIASASVSLDGQTLGVTQTATSGIKKPAYVDSYGGSRSTKNQTLLSFQVPTGLASGTHTITVTVKDGDGDYDVYAWTVTT